MSTFEKKQWSKRQWSQRQWQGKQPARPVGDLISTLLNPVIERRAGMTMDLIATWDEIAGEQHANKSKPEKLVWPRQANEDDPFEAATLIVACEQGHALYLQHDCDAVIANINTYFGFSAVGRIKLVQKPIEDVRQRKTHANLRPLSETKKRDLGQMLDHITDPNLKRALEKMGTGVFREGSD